MAKNFKQSGASMSVLAASAVTSGSVQVIGSTLGVALASAEAGQSYTAAMEGVYVVPKVSAAVIAQGEKVIWVVGSGAFDDSLAVPAAGDVTGAAVAWEAAGAGVTELQVKFMGGVGAIS